MDTNLSHFIILPTQKILWLLDIPSGLHPYSSSSHESYSPSSPNISKLISEHASDTEFWSTILSDNDKAFIDYVLDAIQTPATGTEILNVLDGLKAVILLEFHFSLFFSIDNVLIPPNFFFFFSDADSAPPLTTDEQQRVIELTNRSLLRLIPSLFIHFLLLLFCLFLSFSLSKHVPHQWFLLFRRRRRIY